MLRHVVFLDLGTDKLLRDVLPLLDQVLLLIPDLEVDLTGKKLISSSFPLVLGVSDGNLLPMPLIFLLSLETVLVAEANLSDESRAFTKTDLCSLDHIEFNQDSIALKMQVFTLQIVEVDTAVHSTVFPAEVPLHEPWFVFPEFDKGLLRILCIEESPLNLVVDNRLALNLSQILEIQKLNLDFSLDFFSWQLAFFN